MPQVLTFTEKSRDVIPALKQIYDYNKIELGERFHYDIADYDYYACYFFGSVWNELKGKSDNPDDFDLEKKLGEAGTISSELRYFEGYEQWHFFFIAHQNELLYEAWYLGITSYSYALDRFADQKNITWENILKKIRKLAKELADEFMDYYELEDEESLLTYGETLDFKKFIVDLNQVLHQSEKEYYTEN